jgi:quinol monooxygenase YgiN
VTFLVIAHSQAKAGHEDEFARLIEGIAEPSRKERGSVRYELLRDEADPSRFAVIEEWQDQAAFDAHVASPHIAEFVQASAAITADSNFATYSDIRPPRS